MDAKIAVLPGDGIGVEVTAEARRVLLAVAQVRGHHFAFETALIGGAAIDDRGMPLPDETLELCKAADAVLFGAVGGPKWDDPKARVHPEQGLLSLRRGLGLFANLRPIKPHPALVDASPIKAEILAGTDMMVVRELTGGIYFGQRGRDAGGKEAFDTMVYSEPEIDRVVEFAFRLARDRRRRVTSVDKANVLECSRLWRETAMRVAMEYPDVAFENMLVDACAMHLIRRPSTFDIIVTENMFGDILTDEASMLTGSLGMLPSASLSLENLGLYEPIHGSAPDIAGRGIANPLAAILSAAMLLRYSLKLEDEARLIEKAVDKALTEGYRTPDIEQPGTRVLGTQEMGDLIVKYITA